MTKIDDYLIARLAHREITDADYTGAIARVGAFLKKIRVGEVEKLRLQLELPPEAFGTLLDLYVDELAGVRYGFRDVVPMNSHGLRCHRGEKISISSDDARADAEKRGFTPRAFQAMLPERVFVSAAGTTYGASDWLIHDVLVDGRTQFSQPGGVPGDMFATNAIDGFVSWSEAREKIEMIVEYIGADPDGVAFYASVVGGSSRRAEETSTK